MATLTALLTLYLSTLLPLIEASPCRGVGEPPVFNRVTEPGLVPIVEPTPVPDLLPYVDSEDLKKRQIPQYCYPGLASTSCTPLIASSLLASVTPPSVSIPVETYPAQTSSPAAVPYSPSPTPVQTSYPPQTYPPTPAPYTPSPAPAQSSSPPVAYVPEPTSSSAADSSQSHYHGYKSRSRHRVSKGVIAGAVVGAVALISFLSSALFCCCRRKKQQAATTDFTGAPAAGARAASPEPNNVEHQEYQFVNKEPGFQQMQTPPPMATVGVPEQVVSPVAPSGVYSPSMTPSPPYSQAYQHPPSSPPPMTNTPHLYQPQPYHPQPYQLQQPPQQYYNQPFAASSPAPSAPTPIGSFQGSDKGATATVRPYEGT